jgi:hypothetical protein
MAFVAVQPGCITLTPYTSSIDNYSDTVKYARQNKLQLLRIGKTNNQPYIEIMGLSLNNAGFATDDLYMAHFGDGKIQLQKPNFAV